jgi:aminopeptidase N
MARRGVKLILATLVAALVAAFAADPAAQPDPPGTGFEIELYSVSLEPNLAAKSVAGSERIRVRSLRDGLRTLIFSPNALSIESASVNGRAAQIQSDANGVAFTLPSALDRGRTVDLVLRFHGVPRRGITASDTLMYSSYFACDWMVCLQDSPGDKAWFELDLHVPEGMTGLAAGRRSARSGRETGRSIQRWRTSRPYPAYLFGFAVGRFSQARHRSEGRTFEYHGDAPASELSRLFADTPQMASFYARKAGVPLPDGRYAQLLVAGQEAQEAATYSLIGRGHLERSPENASSQWVIAHELAHQWWGNLVTAESWQHFWLNEGITTFMAAAWKEHRFGASAYRAEMDTARTRVARARAAGWDRPLAFAGPYPNLGTRRAIQYSKGALFMDHLRTMLGEDAFWAGLRLFTRRHSAGTVNSLDFQRAMEQASGHDLGPVFRIWVFG